MDTNPQIEIIPNKVRFVPVSGEKPAEFALSSLSVPTSGIVVPDGCRMYAQEGGQTLFVIEQHPMIRHLACHPHLEEWERLRAQGLLERWKLKPANKKRTVFDLAIPYVVFILRFVNDSFVGGNTFFRTHELMSATDPLFRCGLVPNDCFQINAELIEKEHGMTATTISNQILELFWSQTFGSSHPSSCHPRVPHVQSPWQWEHASLADSTWVFSAPWAATEMDLHQTVRSLLSPSHQSSVHGHAYQVLLDRLTRRESLRVADHLVESASLSLAFSEMTCAIGDQIEAIREQEGITVGKSYLVLGFYHRIDQKQYVLLEGVNKPVLLFTGRGVYFASRLSKTSWLTEVPSVTLGNIVIEPMTQLFLKKKSSDFAELKEGKSYTIRTVCKDLDGDVLVSVYGRTGAFYIALGVVPLPEFDFLIPELKNGKFTCGSLVLEKGDYIRIKTSRREKLKEGRICRIDEITQKKIDSKRAYVVRIGKEEIPLFFSDGLSFTWEKVDISVTPKKLVYADHVIDLSEETVIVNTRTGHSFHPQQFVFDVKDPFEDIQMAVQYGNEMIPVLSHGEWVFSESFLFLKKSITLGSLKIRTRDRFRVIKDLNFMKKDEEVEILGIEEQTENGCRLVFTNGIALGVYRNFSEFLKPLRKDSSIHSKDFETLAEEFSFVPYGDRKPEIGDRVRYLGGDSQVNTGFDNAESLSTLGTIMSVSEKFYAWYCDVRFDIDLPVGNNRGKNYQFLYAQYLAVHCQMDARCFTPFLPTACCIDAKDNRFTIPESLLEQQAYLRTLPVFGKVVGQDLGKRKVRVGDLFVLRKFGFDRSNEAAKEIVGKPCLVVHEATTESGLLFGYFYFGDKVVHGCGFGYGRDKCGQETVPNRYKEWSCEKRYAIELQPFYCGEVLTPIRFEHPEAIKVGEKVRLNIAGTSLYSLMLGRAKEGEAGVVKRELEGGIFEIDFPSHPGWYGRAQDVLSVK